MKPDRIGGFGLRDVPAARPHRGFMNVDYACPTRHLPYQA
jgi:hypothetical protein